MIIVDVQLFSSYSIEYLLLTFLHIFLFQEKILQFITNHFTAI